MMNRHSNETEVQIRWSIKKWWEFEQAYLGGAKDGEVSGEEREDTADIVIVSSTRSEEEATHDADGAECGETQQHCTRIAC